MFQMSHVFKIDPKKVLDDLKDISLDDVILERKKQIEEVGKASKKF